MVKKEGVDYISNFYRYDIYDKEKRVYLITVDDGNFIFVNSHILKQIKRGKIEDVEIFKKLEDKGIVLTEKNIQKVIKKTSNRYQFLTNGTTLHIVIPTSRCNLGCTYCFASPDKISADKNKTDMTDETAKKIIEFILKSPSYATSIEYQGGEAIANFDKIKLMTKHGRELNKIYDKDLEFSIVSNLTLMTDEIVEFLIDNDISICTSLDGPKYVHDKNRVINIKEGKDVGTYDKVIYWIDRINEKYKERGIDKKVNALMTITQYSLPYYKEIIDEYIKHNISLVDIRELTIVGNAANKDEVSHIFYSNDQFKEFYMKSLEYIEELKEKGYNMVERTKDMYETKILENKPTYHTDFESPCGAATGQIVYHSSGDVYTCHESLGREEFKIGNVYTDKWADMFRREETGKAILNSMLESNVKCDRCNFKPYCGTCMVENFYNFGKFHFYPTKTHKHHTTVMQSRMVFDEIYEKIKEEL